MARNYRGAAGCNFDGRVQKDAAASFAQFGGSTSTSSTACSVLTVRGQSVNGFASVYSVSSGESIQAAIDKAVVDGATASKPALVSVGPGVYETPGEPSRIRLSPGVHVAAANQGQWFADDLVVVKVPMYLDDPATAGNPVVISGIAVSPSGILPVPQASPVWVRRGDLALQNVSVGLSGSSPDSVRVGDASFVSSPGPLVLYVRDSNLAGGLAVLGFAQVTIDPTVIGGTLTVQTPTLAGLNTVTCDQTRIASVSFTGAFEAEFRDCNLDGNAGFDCSAFATASSQSRLTLTNCELGSDLSLVGPASQTAFAVLLSYTRALSRTAQLNCSGGVDFEADDCTLHPISSFVQAAPEFPQLLFAVLRRTDFRGGLGSQLNANYVTYSHVQGSLPVTVVFSNCASVALSSIEVGNLTTTCVSCDLVQINRSQLGRLTLSNPDSITSRAYLTETQLVRSQNYSFTSSDVSVTATLCELNSSTLSQTTGSFRNCAFGDANTPLSQSGTLVSGSTVEFDNCRLFDLELDGSNSTNQTFVRLNQCVISNNGSPNHLGAPIRVGTTGSGLGTRLWLSGNSLSPSNSAPGFWLEDSTASPVTDHVVGAGLASGSFPPGGTVGNVLAQIASPLNPTNVTIVPFYFV